MSSPVRFAVVCKLLEQAGYELARVHGSHHIFAKPGSPIVSIPVHRNQVKPFYVRQVQRIVDAQNE